MTIRHIAGMKRLISIFFVLAGILFADVEARAYRPDSVAASLKRPVIGYYNVEIGSVKALATYLSPFSYKGTALAISGFWTKALPVNPEHLSMLFSGRADIGRLFNHAGTALEMDIHGNFQWGMEWKKRFPHNFIAGGGGVVGAYGGMLYLPRNGNNPVAAQFAAGLGLTGSAGWHTVLGRLPILVSDRVTLPFINGFFSQQYGETYYEIYLGNHKDLAHFGWFGNRFGIDNLLSVTLDFGRTAMQVGYRFSYQSEHVSNLDTKITCHSFVIGIIPGGIGLKQKKKETITPLY